ncbi:Prolyl 4-hydroxylase alpha subunit domain-containing protein [Plasmodiophora brassicae]
MGLAKGHSMAVATIAICLPLLWWFQSPGQGIVLDQGVPCVDNGDRVCGRLIFDRFASDSEVDSLLRIVKHGLRFGGGEGPASILDLFSSAVSHGRHFIDVYRALQSRHVPPFNRDDIATFQRVINRTLALAEAKFHVPGQPLYLTSPTFFTRINGSVPPKTKHDVYWETHIDRIQYGSFAVTALLYLNSLGTDFTGGRFLFVNSSEEVYRVEPRRARLLMFSSGSENAHGVEQVVQGSRFALTIAFTRDATKEAPPLRQ